MAQSQNQLMHRKVQEGRLEQAESTVQRLEQDFKELESMIEKVVQDQDARYEELRRIRLCAKHRSSRSNQG